ncbi:MAG: hypothetical protein ACHP7O_05015, partial [Burkholderiales bacterium]
LTCNHQVASSIPAAGTNKNKGLQRCKPLSFLRTVNQVSTVKVDSRILLLGDTLGCYMGSGLKNAIIFYVRQDYRAGAQS